MLLNRHRIHVLLMMVKVLRENATLTIALHVFSISWTNLSAENVYFPANFEAIVGCAVEYGRVELSLSRDRDSERRAVN